MPDDEIAESNERSSLRPKQRVDDFKIKKVSWIKPTLELSSVRLKIKKPKRMPSRIYYLVAGLIVVLAILGIGLQNSKFFAAYNLARSLKNENVMLGFQNSAELRPTGGFWGSFALWQINKNVQDSQILFETNPYKNANQLLKETNIKSPKPIKETWPKTSQSFVNANWSFDFAAAAKTIGWFFGQGWDMQSNGLIGVSSLAMIDLLKLTGPITTSDGATISADNFTQIMSQKIDVDYWQNPENIKTNEPKTILKELAPQILEKTKSISKYKLYKFAVDQMKKGRILCWFSDPKREKDCEKLGIDGSSASYSVDYLSVNNANLAGGKSSLNVTQSFDYSVDNVNGSNQANLQITRAVNDQWPVGVNRNYTRVIAPLGATLTSVKLVGQDITALVDTVEELGKTTFGFWFTVGSNETKTAQLIYELPFGLKKSSDYNLVLQKQPGTLPDRLKIQFSGKILYEGTSDQNLVRVNPR